MDKFGIYLNQIRISQGISQREMAKILSMRQSNAVKLLKGELIAPEKEQRMNAYKALKIDSNEILKLEKEALKERHETDPEINDYLSECPSALEAINLARDMGEGDDFWEEVRQWLLRIKETRA